MFKVEINFTFNVPIVLLFIYLNQYLLQWSIIGFDCINKIFFFQCWKNNSCSAVLWFTLLEKFYFLSKFASFLVSKECSLYLRIGFYYINMIISLHVTRWWQVCGNDHRITVDSDTFSAKLPWDSTFIPLLSAKVTLILLNYFGSIKNKFIRKNCLIRKWNYRIHNSICT